MKVIPLNKGDRKQAAAVVARAFFDYPSLKTYFPDTKRREQKLPCYMEHVLKSAMRYGEVYRQRIYPACCFFSRRVIRA
jgi:hypothetical protein